jgi:hypothetical protein
MFNLIFNKCEVQGRIQSYGYVLNCIFKLMASNWIYKCIYIIFIIVTNISITNTKKKELKCWILSWQPTLILKENHIIFQEK